MPNGGSDCCGTCWFNRANDEARDADAPAAESVCAIRDELAIENAYWTYCANHPHHNPERIETPVGPVYSAGDLGGGGYGRSIWVAAPDTEEIRLELLGLLANATQAATELVRRYPAGRSIVEAAIGQLGELTEARALADLDRLRSLPVEPTDDAFIKPERLTWIARTALAQIVPPASVEASRSDRAVELARRHVEGDGDARAVLADALEEAGCELRVVLDYLRGPHVGPCWVVDVLRGVEPVESPI